LYTELFYAISLPCFPAFYCPAIPIHLVTFSMSFTTCNNYVIFAIFGDFQYQLDSFLCK